jgi:hypothetical protein
VHGGRQGGADAVADAKCDGAYGGEHQEGTGDRVHTGSIAARGYACDESQMRML